VLLPCAGIRAQSRAVSSPAAMLI